MSGIYVIFHVFYFSLSLRRDVWIFV